MQFSAMHALRKQTLIRVPTSVLITLISVCFTLAPCTMRVSLPLIRSIVQATVLLIFKYVLGDKLSKMEVCNLQEKGKEKRTTRGNVCH
jgi:hypothetical protein